MDTYKRIQDILNSKAANVDALVIEEVLLAPELYEMHILPIGVYNPKDLVFKAVIQALDAIDKMP